MKKLNIAFCLGLALLCASCATSTKTEDEKKNPQEISQMYTDLGTQALMRREFSQAVTDLKKAITLDERNSVAHNHLGLAFYGLGKKALAKAEINQAISIAPQYSDAYINLGKFAEDEKNYALAREYYRTALENLEYKMRHRALTNLAHLAIRENNNEEAKRLLYQSIQVNSEYCLSRFLLGTLLMREKNPIRAAEEFKKSVVSTCTNNVEAHYQLGIAYLQTRQFEKAKAQFVFLIDQYPQTLEGQRAGEQLRNIP